MKQLKMSLFYLIFNIACVCSAITNTVKSDTGSVMPLKNSRIGPGIINLQSGLRFRGEYFSNRTLKVTGSGTDDNLLYTRFTAGLQYTFDFGLGVLAECYDSRMFFNEFTADDFTPSCPHENRIDLYRGFVEYRSPGSVSVGARAGRQTITFGDERIWSPGLWNNSYKYRWDGVRAFLESKPLRLNLIWGRCLRVDPGSFDKLYYDYHAVGIYTELKALPFNLHVFYVGKYDQSEQTKGESGTGPLAVTSLGVYGDKKIGSLQLQGTGVGQFGTYGNDRISAGAFNFNAHYTFEPKIKPGILLGYTFGSGDQDPTDGIRGTFDGLFGSAAKYYGRMNLFYWQNLHDLQADFTIAPIKKTRLELSYHYFLLVSAKDAWYGTNGNPQKHSNGSPHRDKTGRSGTELGHELDIVATTTLVPFTKIMFGFGHFFSGTYVRKTALINSEKKSISSLFLQAEFQY